MTNISRQWAVGDGGIRGVRKVHTTGHFQWQGHTYQAESLKRFAGNYVFVEDFAGAGITVSQCLWSMHRSFKTGSPYAGAIICEVK